MGNEERGISDEMRSLADETFYLPMCGFAESFNLSVATAITLAYMKAASGRSGGVAGSVGNVAGTELVLRGSPVDLAAQALQFGAGRPGLQPVRGHLPQAQATR